MNAKKTKAEKKAIKRENQQRKLSEATIRSDEYIDTNKSISVKKHEELPLTENKPIRSIKEFIVKLEDRREDSFLFRGQSNAAWDVESSAYRRLKKKFVRDGEGHVPEKQEKDYNIELISQARMEDFYSESVSDIAKSQLGILAQLQHNRAATSLIDFSANPLVALWFACQESLLPKNNNKKEGQTNINNKDSDNQEDNKKSHGKVFILNTTKELRKFSKVDDPDKLKKYKIDELLSGEKWVYWKPAHLNNRITAQYSYFVIGKRKLPKMKEIIISREHKDKILRELSKIYGIKETSLFPDPVGFAEANSVNSNYGKTARDYLDLARQAFYDEKIEEAIMHCEETIKYCHITKNKSAELIEAHKILCHLKILQAGENKKTYKIYLNDAKDKCDASINIIDADKKLSAYKYEFYSLRGTIKSLLGDEKDAMADHEQAINTSPESSSVYYMSGISKRMQKDQNEAIKDFDRVIQIDSSDKDAYKLRGNAKSDAGKFAEALKDYNKALELDVNNEDEKIYLMMGMAESELNNKNAAKAYYDKALKIKPNYSEVYYQQGLLQARSKKYEEALNYFNKAIKNNPKYNGAYFHRGITELKLKKYKDAIADFDKAIELEYKKDIVYSARADAKGEMEDYQGALDDYNAAIKINSKSYGFYINRGSIKGKLKDNKGAMDDYDKAIKINPDSFPAYLNRANTKEASNDNHGAFQDYDRVINLINKPGSGIKGDVFILYIIRGNIKNKLKKYKESIIDYNKAIMLKSNSSEAYAQRGRIKHMLEEYQSAIEDFNKAIKYNSNDVTAYISRALSKVRLNRNNASSAFNDFDKAITIQSDDHKIFHMRGIVRGMINEDKEAIEDFNKSIEINSKYSEVYYHRGISKLSLGNTESSIIDFDKAIEIKSDYAEAYRVRAGAREKLGEHQGALADYNKAIGYKPEFEEAYNGRGDLKNKLENYDEAIKDTNKAIDINPDHAISYCTRGEVQENLYKKKGDYKYLNEAINDYEKVMELTEKDSPDYEPMERTFAKERLKSLKPYVQNKLL